MKLNMTNYSSKQYKDVKRLYRFHQQRMHYDFLFEMILPNTIKRMFFKNYHLKNAYQTKVILGIIKAVLFSLAGYSIFSLTRVTEWQVMVVFHFLFLWIFIISAAYQIHMKTDLHKNDFLMMLLGDYKKQLLIDEINEKMCYSYITSIMPLTLITMCRIAILDQMLVFIPLFLLFQVLVFIISKLIIIKLYQLKYLVNRHSFFRDFFHSLLFGIASIIVYGIIFSPLLLVDEASINQTTYVLGFIYGVLISLFGYIFINRWVYKFVSINFLKMMYPKLFSVDSKIDSVYFKQDSVFLRGLDEIEKAIVIKDQKMFKRKNRKEYYGVLFFGIVLIFTAIQYLTRAKDDQEFLSIFILSFVYSGVAFMFHMITTSLASRFLSFRSEGSLTQTYQRLSISKKSIYRAKLRIFSFMTLPINVIYLLSLSIFLWTLTFQGLLLFVFNVLYFLGISRLKLKNFVFSDIQVEHVYLNDYQANSFYTGSAIVIGLFFSVLVPLGIGLFANALLDAFGISYVYLMMSGIIFIVFISNIINDFSIRKQIYT